MRNTTHRIKSLTTLYVGESGESTVDFISAYLYGLHIEHMYRAWYIVYTRDEKHLYSYHSYLHASMRTYNIVSYVNVHLGYQSFTNMSTCPNR